MWGERFARIPTTARPENQDTVVGARAKLLESMRSGRTWYETDEQFVPLVRRAIVDCNIPVKVVTARVPATKIRIWQWAGGTNLPKETMTRVRAYDAIRTHLEGRPNWG
mgnify:FL=1